MRYQIEAPVRNFTGDVAGVHFHNGTGYVDDATDAGRAALAYFRRQHYGVLEAEDKDLPAMVMDQVTGTEQEPPGSIAQTGALTDGPFDPARHSVEAVIAHLNGADAAEAERVLDAEAAGKNRAGIVKHRYAVLASKQPDPAPADDEKGSAK